MKNHKLFLTGFDQVRDYLNPWLVFLITILSILAFWPKVKASVIGKLTRENIRLRGIIADLTIEEEIKNVVLLANKKQIEELQHDVVELRRSEFEQLRPIKIPRVLIVDDDRDIPCFLRHYAEQWGYALEFIYASDVGEAIDRLNEQCCDAAVIDVMLGGVTGVSLAQEIRKHDTLIPLAYFSNLDPDDPANEEVMKQAELHRAQYLYKARFLMKPDDGPRELLEIISHLASMNPCLPGGVRIDDQGFERQLPTTPMRMAEPFMRLLNHNRTIARAA